MHYENKYEIMIWIDFDYELSDLNYTSSMKKFELVSEKVFFQQAYYMKMYEKVFFNKLIILKCINHLNIVSFEVWIYLGLNDTGRARRDSYEAL